MKKQTRIKLAPAFNAKVALETVKNQQTLAELAKKFEVNPIMISRWKAEWLENMAAAFETGQFFLFFISNYFLLAIFMISVHLSSESINFFCFNVFFIAFSLTIGSSLCINSKYSVGTTCHDNPYLSLHHPQEPSSPPFLVRASQ